MALCNRGLPRRGETKSLGDRSANEWAKLMHGCRLCGECVLMDGWWAGNRHADWSQPEDDLEAVCFARAPPATLYARLSWSHRAPGAHPSSPTCCTWCIPFSAGLRVGPSHSANRDARIPCVHACVVACRQAAPTRTEWQPVRTLAQQGASPTADHVYHAKGTPWRPSLCSLDPFPFRRRPKWQCSQTYSTLEYSKAIGPLPLYPTSSTYTIARAPAPYGKAGRLEQLSSIATRTSIARIAARYLIRRPFAPHRIRRFLVGLVNAGEGVRERISSTRSAAHTLREDEEEEHCGKWHIVEPKKPVVTRLKVRSQPEHLSNVDHDARPRFAITRHKCQLK